MVGLSVKSKPLFLAWLFISLSFSSFLPSIIARPQPLVEQGQRQLLKLSQNCTLKTPQRQQKQPLALIATLYRDQNGNPIQVQGSFDFYPQGPTRPSDQGQLLGVEKILADGAEAGRKIIDKAADQIVKRAPGGMARQFLRVHNEARAKAGMPALSWDRNVSRYARRYAQQRKADCEMIHSNGGPYGENIFWGAGAGWKPGDVVTLWVGEQQNYDAKSNACAPGKTCGHYTQVVWKNSQKLGCARVVCNSGDVFITCNYDPPGNYQGISPFS